ncbi:hypothetical protein AB0G74_18100 [Streptomyces sp. NPDC020875]|uniref:ARPP-2 domain-containing protein n=1 Tax=Streptomyces sp. NPDC020875 TaxID=3154898 RepID=UPI0033FDBA01
MSGLDMTGLTTGPAQVWGGVRLVPLLRAAPVAGLRLYRGPGGAEPGGDPCQGEIAYVPHGLVADWSAADGTGGGNGAEGDGEGGATAAYGTRLGIGAARPLTVPVSPRRLPVRRLRGPARGGGRAREDRLRFLPLQLALGGYLALHFRRPTVAWETWSREALTRGLSPREQAAYAGLPVPGLDEALRVFEIHPGQCGVLLYTADDLAGAFVVPHPEDYRALHATLVEDLYGESVHHHAVYGRPVPAFKARLGSGRGIRDLADLRAAARRAEAAWARDHDAVMAAGLLAGAYRFERVYTLGGFTLERFLPPFVPGREQHIGELIRDRKGRTVYLKTFRLSEAQVRRGHLLDALHGEDWDPERAARALGTTADELARRIRRAGLAALLRHG